jgi:hypothetical protein
MLLWWLPRSRPKTPISNSVFSEREIVVFLLNLIVIQPGSIVNNTLEMGIEASIHVERWKLGAMRQLLLREREYRTKERIGEQIRLR